MLARSVRLSIPRMLLFGWLVVTGCSQPRPYRSTVDALSPTAFQESASSPIQLASFVEEPDKSEPEPETLPEPRKTVKSKTGVSLTQLEQETLARNPRLLQLFDEYRSASARSRYVSKLPDPKIGAGVFANPVETAAGSQRAFFNVSQVIPWLAKLDALEQQAILEALAVRTDLDAERLRLLSAVRVGWAKLYIIGKQIEVAEANQILLKSLIELANARIATGTATQGDVLSGSLELTKIEERLLDYRRQETGVIAELNRLAVRPPETPIELPETIETTPIEQTADSLFELAVQSQPEIQAALLRVQAARWGVTVARLMRRPEFMLTANTFVTDNNRPASKLFTVGQDPFSFAVQLSVPLGREKYDAIRDEAVFKQSAMQRGVDVLSDRYSASILDLLAEYRRTSETAALYKSTILPQAEQTLEADQSAYANGSVEFDRVITDLRNLLTLQIGYHESVGAQSIAMARLQQLAGRDFITVSKPTNK